MLIIGPLLYRKSSFRNRVDSLVSSKGDQLGFFWCGGGGGGVSINYYELMDLRIFYSFNSIALIILMSSQTVPSLESLWVGP